MESNVKLQVQKICNVNMGFYPEIVALCVSCTSRNEMRISGKTVNVPPMRLSIV